MPQKKYSVLKSELTQNFAYHKIPKHLDMHTKIWARWLHHRVMYPKDGDRMANSVNPDQTQQSDLSDWAVWFGSTLFAQTCIKKFRNTLVPSACIWAMSWENLFMPYGNIKGADCADAQADQHICCLLPRWYNISSFYIWNFKPLPSFCSCAGQFESTLITNPEDSLSHDEAKIIHVTLSGLMSMSAVTY